MAGNRLIQTIQSMAKPPVGETTDLLFGEVTSVSPLKIRVDNRFEVDSQFLILSELVKEKVITIDSHNHNVPSYETLNETIGAHNHNIAAHETSEEEDHTHDIASLISDDSGLSTHKHGVSSVNTSKELTKITLWRGLRVGDKVRLLRVSNGQMYYIIEREEGVV